MNAFAMFIAAGLAMLTVASDGDNRPYESFFGKVAPTNNIDIRVKDLNLEKMIVNSSGFHSFQGVCAFNNQ